MLRTYMRISALVGTMLWSALLFADHHNVDFDRHADFSKVKTFAMREGKGDSSQPELNNSLIVKKIDDDGRSAAATTKKNIALFDAIKSTADYATSIASRNVEAADSKEKSRALAARLRSLSGP